MKVLQISIEVNSGSVGRIAEQIGEQILVQGWESFITYARNNQPSKSTTIRIGTMKDVYWHVLMTRIFDNHCFESKRATKKLIENIKLLQPDIVHLHHLHGYFINIKILFKYLSTTQIPLVWTFHDCWNFTGHCAHYEFVDCQKWQIQCYSCPQKHQYPKSLFLDRSRKNYMDKKRIFASVNNMTIVPVSYWLGEQVEKSFLNKYPVKVIQNGIDLDIFKPLNYRQAVLEKYAIGEQKFIVLGVAGTWEHRKGLNYFIELSGKISNDYQIILVGLTKNQLMRLPYNIIGIERTENVNDLALLYSTADVFVNPTLEDTFPTTNIEALACGTPVITFNSGGAPEIIDINTGFVVKKGDTTGLIEAILEIEKKGKPYYSEFCRKRAEEFFNKNDRFLEYIELYKSVLKKAVR